MRNIFLKAKNVEFVVRIYIDNGFRVNDHCYVIRRWANGKFYSGTLV